MIVASELDGDGEADGNNHGDRRHGRWDDERRRCESHHLVLVGCDP